jgi:hypothetical protein
VTHPKIFEERLTELLILPAGVKGLREQKVQNIFLLKISYTHPTITGDDSM